MCDVAAVLQKKNASFLLKLKAAFPGGVEASDISFSYFRLKQKKNPHPILVFEAFCPAFLLTECVCLCVRSFTKPCQCSDSLLAIEFFAPVKRKPAALKCSVFFVQFYLVTSGRKVFFSVR